MVVAVEEDDLPEAFTGSKTVLPQQTIEEKKETSSHSSLSLLPRLLGNEAH